MAIQFASAVARGAYGMASGVARSGAVRGGVGAVGRGLKAYGGTAMHKRGMRWLREGYGLGAGQKMLGRMLGLGFLAYSFMEGYQREGLWGGVKEAATGAAYSYAFGAVLGSAAIPLMGGAAVVGGAVGLQTFMNKKGESYSRRQKSLEMGGTINDMYGSVATMRRRSIMSLNRSKIGGGMGIGNEALRQYQPYFR